MNPQSAKERECGTNLKLKIKLTGKGGTSPNKFENENKKIRTRLFFLSLKDR